MESSFNNHEPSVNNCDTVLTCISELGADEDPQKLEGLPFSNDFPK